MYPINTVELYWYNFTYLDYVIRFQRACVSVFSCVASCCLPETSELF